MLTCGWPNVRLDKERCRLGGRRGGEEEEDKGERGKKGEEEKRDEKG